MSDVRGQPGGPAHELPPIKLLFDQNLSHRLPPAVADVYPDAAHVRDFSLERAEDDVVWNFAKSNGFTIVSKDTDFHHLSFARGAPPRVIWLANAPVRPSGAAPASVALLLGRFGLSQALLARLPKEMLGGRARAGGPALAGD